MPENRDRLRGDGMKKEKGEKREKRERRGESKAG